MSSTSTRSRSRTHRREDEEDFQSGENFLKELEAITDEDSDLSDDSFADNHPDHITSVNTHSLPPLHNEPQPFKHTANFHSFAHPSSSGLVTPDAAVPGSSEALPSAEALHA